MKAWQLLDSKKKWCQGLSAVDNIGNLVDYESPDACKWCVVGALLKCYEPGPEYRSKIMDIRANIGNRLVARWNDTSTYEEIHALLKELDI